MAKNDNDQILKGLLDTLVLNTLSKQANYGVGIKEALREQLDEDAEVVKEATLYPLLHRLERRELLISYRQPGERATPRKYYKIFFFQAEDCIRDGRVTGVQTCALPICGASAARQASRSNGAQWAPAIPLSASGWIPTGVASTGTSHASASSTASPKPSRSDGTSTAFAALTHSGTSAGATVPSDSSATAPATCCARSWRFSGRAGSAGNSRHGRSGSRPSARRASARGIGRKRSISTPDGSTALRCRTAHRGTVLASGSDTVATRSSSGS